MLDQSQHKHILSELFSVALSAVNGCHAVEQQLAETPLQGKVAVLAVGKAAVEMFQGAKNSLLNQIQSALIITKDGYANSYLDFPCIEAGHPIPNEKSLSAGKKLIEFITDLPEDVQLLALISGGASALVEVLPEGMGLDDLQNLNNILLSSGSNIHDMNKIRQALSLIKGGKALNYFDHNSMTQFLLSDVKGDEPSVIGSGLFIEQDKNNSIPNIPNEFKKFTDTSLLNKNVLVDSYIVASNEMACRAVIKHAEQSNYKAAYHGQTLYGDVYELVEKLFDELMDADSGVHIWGGEPTIVLPAKVGRGGRNQSLALALACKLENVKGITVLVAATDGSDGPTDDVGAIIDGLTLQRGNGSAQDFLDAADAGTFLASSGDLLSTGPTGTNVMDIVIALKAPI